METSETEKQVETLPRCTFCERDAAYFAKANNRKWAHMCETHWGFYGIQKLGPKHGHRLVLKAAV